MEISDLDLHKHTLLKSFHPQQKDEFDPTQDYQAYGDISRSKAIVNRRGRHIQTASSRGTSGDTCSEEKRA